MKTYKCHKVVRAARILEVYENTLVFGEGEEFLLSDSQKAKFSRMAREAVLEIYQGYFVEYEDGYVSWSPVDVFEKGYTELREPSQEEMIYRNIEAYLRAAIIDLADLEDSEMDVINCLVNAISNMKYAVQMQKERRQESQRKLMGGATKCGL